MLCKSVNLHDSIHSYRVCYPGHLVGIVYIMHVTLRCLHVSLILIASSPGSLFRQRAWSLISHERTQKSANINERGCNKPHAHDALVLGRSYTFATGQFFA